MLPPWLELEAVQKTLVFWTALNTLEVSYLSYLAESPETRYNNQSLERDSFHEFLYCGDYSCRPRRGSSPERNCVAPSQINDGYLAR